MVSAEYNFEDTIHPIEIKESISLIEEGAIVDLVVSSVISEDDDVWVYSPNFYTYALYANLLKFFTDYEVTENTKLDDTYRLINESDIVEVLEENASPVQLESIRTAIENKLNYYMDFHIARVSSQSQINGLAADLRSLIAKWDKKLEKVFKPRVMEKALKNISQIDVNSKSLSEAVVAAYKADKDNAGTINSIADLERFLSSPQGQDFIASQDAVQAIMRSEAQRFKKLLQARIDQYYDSYEPQIYDREYKLKGSLRIKPNIEVADKGMQIVVYFADEMVKRPGIFNGNVVSTAVLINSGWQVKKNVWFRDVPHFGWQKGFHFIEKAIADFYSNNPYKIKISIENYSF